MSTRDPTVSLRQMRDHVQEAMEGSANRSRAGLEKDRLLMHALTRLVEVVGEAAQRVPKQIQQELDGIPWPKIIGMRHKLIHGYDEIDLDILWATVKDDFPVLLTAIDAALGEL